MSKPQDQRWEIVDAADGRTVHFFGRWTLAGTATGDWAQLRGALTRGIGSRSMIRFDTSGIERWDVRFVAGLSALIDSVEESDGRVDTEGLEKGMRELLDLAKAVPEASAEGDPSKGALVDRVGKATVEIGVGFDHCLRFVGRLVIDFGTLLRGRATLRGKDFLLLLRQCGPQALPIVSLLAFLTGVIIAYIAVLQLQKLGADIYVADLVGLVMTRELAAVMAGVIMAGRTGAAYAASIGSMVVNEEIDALESFGISPSQFLVVPKVIALVLMMPLLTALAMVISIFGGMLIAVSLSNVSVTQYHLQIVEAVGLSDVITGLFKSVLFGLVIALSGCYRGLRCGRDAASVGRATTAAVVTAITWIVVVDAVCAVVFNILGL